MDGDPLASAGPLDNGAWRLSAHVRHVRLYKLRHLLRPSCGNQIRERVKQLRPTMPCWQWLVRVRGRRPVLIRVVLGGGRRLQAMSRNLRPKCRHIWNIPSHWDSLPNSDEIVECEDTRVRVFNYTTSKSHHGAYKRDARTEDSHKQPLFLNRRPRPPGARHAIGAARLDTTTDTEKKVYSFSQKHDMNSDLILTSSNVNTKLSLLSHPCSVTSIVMLQIFKCLKSKYRADLMPLS